MSEESIKPPPEFNNSLAPALNDINTKLLAKLDGLFLKQDKVTFSHKQIVNICYA